MTSMLARFNQTTKEFVALYPTGGARDELGRLNDIGAPVTPALLDRLLAANAYERTGDWLEVEHPFLGMSIVKCFEAEIRLA